jgi:hypothetical protein
VIGNKEEFRTYDWKLLRDSEKQQALAMAAEDHKLFSASINAGITDFLNAHQVPPRHCQPSHQTRTTILVIEDDAGMNNSKITIHRFSMGSGSWTKEASEDISVRRLENGAPQLVTGNTPFELNMATDLPAIVEQALLQIRSKLGAINQTQMIVSGHGGHALLNGSTEINLFANEAEDSQKEHLIMFDTFGPNGPVSSELYAPVWRTTTVRRLCVEGGKASEKSVTCLATARGDQQVAGNGSGTSGNGSGTSGNGSGTSGNGSGTSGDSSNTSGKIFRTLMPVINAEAKTSNTNPEGIVQAGAVASYTISEGKIAGVFPLAFNWGELNKPSLLMLNSCYQSKKIESKIHGIGNTPVFTLFNPGPIYSWVVNFGILDDFEYRSIPFLLDRGDRQIQNLMKNGIAGEERVLSHVVPSQKGDFCINKEYCTLETARFTLDGR